MKAYCVGLFLLLAGNAVSQDPSRFDHYTDEHVAWVREFYKDPENLKKSLMDGFTSDHFADGEEIPFYRQKFGITDDTLLCPILIDIYKSAEHVGKDIPKWSGVPWERIENQRRLYSSIVWLGYCADEPAKRLLLDIACDDTKYINYRLVAIMAYLQRADAQQARDTLVRVLIGDMQVKPYSAYLYAFEVYDESESDPLKREAIIASLMVALAREENKVEFAERDKMLAARNKEYATSTQRLAMVQRMSKLPPSQSRDTDPDLKAALKSFRFRFFKTNVSTNLTELMARDFTKPLEEGKQ